jgi:hypothetical protein
MSRGAGGAIGAGVVTSAPDRWPIANSTMLELTTMAGEMLVEARTPE